MKIQFKLDFDDYLHWQKARLRKPDLTLAMTSVVVGAICLLLGIVVVSSGPERSKTAGIVILGLGLLTTFAGVPLGLTAPKRTKSEDEAVLRSEYERFWSYPITFEADDRGWKISSTEGEDIRVWNNIYYFKEGDRLIEFMSAFDRYVIPKSALSGPDQEQLREWFDQRFTETESAESWYTRIERSDYVAAQTLHHWRNHRTLMPLLYCMGIAFAILFIVEGVENWEHGSVVQVTVAALVIVLLLGGERLFYIWHFRSHGAHLDSESLVPMTGGICIRGASSHYIVRWDWLDKVLESRKIFLLYVTPDRFVIVPKRRLTGEQISDLRRLVGSKLRSSKFARLFRSSA